jgi:hypothetical protein
MTTSPEQDPGDLAPGDLAPEGATSRRRPTPVTILALLQIVLALLLAAVAVEALLDPGSAAEFLRGLAGESGIASIPAADLAAGVVLIFGFAAGLELFAAVALLQVRRIGWTLTVLLAGASLATQIFTWWSSGEVDSFSMLLSIVTVLYLNQGPVRAAFGLTDARGRDLVDERG